MYDTYNECLTKLTSSFSLAKAPIRVVPRSTPFPLHARGGLVAAIRNLFRELEIAPTPEILRPVCAKIHSILNPGFHEEATKKDSLTLTFHCFTRCLIGIFFGGMVLL